MSSAKHKLKKDDDIAGFADRVGGGLFKQVVGTIKFGKIGTKIKVLVD